MAALKRDRLAQAGHQFSGRIQNSDHGAQLLGNFNVGGNITFHQSSGQSHQERLRECRKALHLGRSDPHDDRAKIIAVKTKTGRIIAASCEWITMHLRYRSWESPSTGSRLLWISSDEGLGKTMTAIYLTQKLEETATKGKDSTVVYFFIERQDKKNTAVDVLCGLLLRLLAARKDSDELTEHLLEEHDLQKDALFEKDAIEALWRLFVKMITDPIAGQVYCIIDGLDNCTDESLRRLISRITNFFLDKPQVAAEHCLETHVHEASPAGPSSAQRRSEQRRDAGLKMILVSRNKPEWIAEQLREFPRIDIGVRGRKAGGSSQSIPASARRPPTLASVIADVMRKQRLEKFDNSDAGVRNSPSNSNTVATQKSLSSASAMIVDEARGLAATPHRQASVRSLSTKEPFGQADKVDLQLPSCSGTLGPNQRTEACKSLPSQPRVFELDAMPQHNRPGSASGPTLPPRPQYRDAVLAHDRHDEACAEIDNAHVADEEIEEDYGGESLRQYIKVRLDELIAERKWSVEASNYVNASLEYLWYRGDDTFLWVDFAIEEVRKAAGDAASIESVLISLPPTLTEMYSYILRKIPQNLVELVADLLRWSVCARQPMKVLELTVALKLTSHGRGAAKQLILNAVSACGNMLMVNAEDDTVNIVHNSLVDFLSADSSPIHQDARLATFIVRTSKIHNDIANSCIAYLEGGCLEKGSICRKENEVTFNQRLAQFPFMAYAMAHWPNHLQDAGTPRLDFSSPFFQHKSKIRKNWWHTYWAEYTGDSILFAPMNFTLLHLAGHRGLVYIAQQMLQHGELQARLDKRDSHGYTPLEYSVMYGHMQMFQYLTDIGATQKDSAETLLELACRGGQQEIAERLIQRGFDVNMRAQSRSVKESVYKATKFLPGTITEGLAWRIVNRYFGEHETPLVTAAMYGHSAVVGMLLDRGAIIDAETTKGYTPLHAASDQGQTECVETLLERGARVAARTSEGWTALHFAAWRGKLPVVKIFLNMGLNLDMMTTKSKTPLHLAAYEGQADVVRALVDRGAYMEHMSHKGETPLHLATRNGKPQVVEILLSRGANRDAMTKEGKTPCKIAKGSKTTVGKECMRILQTFGTPGYQPWKPPKGADADAGSDTGLDDYNDEATKSIQDSLRKGSQASVNLQSSLAAKAARVLSPKVEFQAKLDLKALNQPPAQNRMLSRVQSEPIYGPSRFSYQSAANYTISPAQQYVLDDAPPPYMPPVSGSTSQVPGISLEKSPAVTVSRKALHQTTWQAPPQVQEYSSPSATPVMGQSQYMPPENPYQAVKQPYAQPSMVQMINSMSLKSGSAPDPTAPVTSTAPHHQVAAPGSPFTYANHFDRSSYSPMPTFQARVFPDSLRFHAAAASVMAPSQPTDPMQQLPPPQRLQHNPQQDFAHHRSHTVPIVQQTQPYQQPYQQSHRQPPQQQQQYSAAYPSLYTTSSPQPPQNYAYIPPTTQSPQFTGNSTASTYNSTYQYSAPPVTQPYNPGLGVNGNAMLFAPPPTQDHSLKKRKSFFGGLIG